MKTMERIKSLWTVKNVIITALAAVVLFTVTGFFIVPPVLKMVMVKKLSENLHRDVAVRDIDFNPYVLTLTVEGFDIKQRGTPDTFVSFDELYANLQIISLFKLSLIVKELKLQEPHVRLVRNEDGTYNFSDLMGGGESDS
jgi:uncharacterized protein involved in outer membrane biogenesis